MTVKCYLCWVKITANYCGFFFLVEIMHFVQCHGPEMGIKISNNIFNCILMVYKHIKVSKLRKIRGR